MISKETIISELNQEYEILCALMSGSKGGISHKMLRYVEKFKESFEKVLNEFGDIDRPEQLKELCKKIGEVQEELEASVEVDPHIFSIIDRTRRKVKKRLAVVAGWEKDSILKNGKLTDYGIGVINRAREVLGFKPVIDLGEGQYLTPEEIRAYAVLANELGEVALAEYLAGLLPERFAFNNRLIKGLRPYLGEFETSRGGGPENVPVKLLVLPKFSHLRKLLFNNYRDKYYPVFRDGGSDAVEAELMVSMEKAASEPERAKFMDELIKYFKDVESIKCPFRLKSDLGKDTRFPAAHQLISIAEIEKNRQMMIADGMGGGKTGSAIAAFEYLRQKGKATRCLVICPSEIVTEWQKRLTSNEQGYFQDGKEPKVVVIRSGDNKRAQTWKDAKDADYIVMSIPMLREETDGKSHVDFARELGVDYYVIDEVHNAKNPRGSDTRRIYNVSQCDSIKNGYTVLLTGTPVPNTIKDLAAQIRLLHASQDRKELIELSKEKIDFSNLKELARVITKNNTRLVRNLLMLRMLRRPTEDCLPVGTEVDVEAPMESELMPIEAAAYETIYEDPFYEVNEKIEYMRRICAHDNANNPKFAVPGTGTAKYQALKDSIDEFMDELKEVPDAHDGKILIAINGYSKGITRDFNDNNNFETSDLDSYVAGRLKKDYEDKGVKVFVLDGELTGSKLIRDEDGNSVTDFDGAYMTVTRKLISEFRNHKGPAVLVTKTEIIGEGLDFSFTSRGILLAPTFTMADRDQFYRRLYRKGQKRNVRFRTLQCAGTIEQGMTEYALRKQQIIEALIEGRPLNDFEQDLINDGINKIKEGGFLAYEVMSPRQKVLWFLNKMKSMNKLQMKEFFELEEGKYTREFAELYHLDWETTFSGNTARLVTAILKDRMDEFRGQNGEEINIADVACGGLTLVRMLEDEESVNVWSSDIMGAMLEVGKQLIKKKMPKNQIHEVPMDDLPYADETMHMVVNSLALQYARHNSRQKAGKERIYALIEMNRVLIPGGIALLALPPNCIEDMEKFNRIVGVLNKNFGFELVSNTSGYAVACDRQDEEQFGVYVMTLRKTGDVCVDSEPDVEFWKTLSLKTMRKAKVPTGTERTPKPDKQVVPQPGAFHEQFKIGDRHITYDDKTRQEEQRVKFDKEKADYQEILDQIAKLLDEHGTIKDIPAEKLLSIPLTEVAKYKKQKVREAYFRALINKYDGNIARIPIEEINAESQIILQCGYTDKKGYFLYLVDLRNTNKKRKGGRKRYFFESEFVKDDSTDFSDASDLEEAGDATTEAA